MSGDFEPFEHNGYRFRWEPRMVKATNLSGDEYLADGAIVLKTSVQLEWVYATVVIDGHVRRRRYRWGRRVRCMHVVPDV